MIEKAGRRTSQRVMVKIPVRYVQTGGAQGEAQITELSAGGCVLNTTQLDLRGPDVFLHFTLGKENQEIHLRARVIHVLEGAGTGLEFGLISPEGRELLRQEVAAAMADPKPSP